jgi:two-component system response regulator YesN
MLHLLIVEDEAGIREGIAQYFPWSQVGIQVAATCRNGAEALAYVSKHHVDLVLCDVRMPEVDGIQFAETLRRWQIPCEIVFISAHKDFEYARRAMELGVKSYIVKPAGYEELYAVFSRIVHERAAAAATEVAAPEPAAEAEAAGDTDLGLAERTAMLLERDLANVKLTSVARELGMSPNHFSSRFHRETGRTFTSFLQEARLSRARDLLAGPHHIYEISRKVGYASVKSFTRAFRGRFGAPPQAYRKARHD